MAEAHDPHEHMPHNTLPSKIGDFEILRSLGRGGMGEVFLAYDRLCERKVALKRIRPELVNNQTVRERFLREARFASKLSHPCVIPIYGIYQDHDGLYYTMPFVEGETLKDIFKHTLEKEEKGEAPHEIGVSIPALTRIFNLVCQAVAFAHSKFILHRDIKPENIIVGKFSEVFILDWGIAGYFNEGDLKDEPISLVEDKPDLTKPGKVFGTINYMAPERAMKSPATIQTEIYSLGVILYQILTLNFPFKRKSLDLFRKTMKFEKLIPPEEIAPYRDIPKQLSKIAEKALSQDPKDRYQKVDELLFDLENYIEGRPEWVLMDKLEVKSKQHWEFQENVLMTKHLAITKVLDFMEWAMLMLSKKPYLGNIRIEFDIHLLDSGSGIGILLCVPESHERKGLEDGYCLWIGGASHPYSTLFRSNAEVLSIPSNGIKSDASSHICIEKIDNSVRLYVDGNLKLQYISHIPIVGSYIGLIYKDPSFHISTIRVYAGSQQAMVNCLSIPDAFLANKNFSKAYSEYKRISYSFHGRIEGREAQFRAGLALLEKAKRTSSSQEREDLLSQATEEFEMLRATPGAPLEYLGKSLVYHLENEIDEEIKCLELALRKYPKHPLLAFLREQIVFRLHESSTQDRFSAYHFLLLVLRHLPEIFLSYEHRRLLDHLVKHWEKLPFIDDATTFSETKYEYLHLAIQIAFWLCKPIALIELLYLIPDKDPEKSLFFGNILFSLIKLNCHSIAKEKLIEYKHQLLSLQNTQMSYMFSLLELVFNSDKPLKKLENFFSLLHGSLTNKELRVFSWLIEKACEYHTLSEILPWITTFYSFQLIDEKELILKELHLKILLKYRSFNDCHNIFDNLTKETLEDPQSPFFLYYGIYLLSMKRKDAAKAHLQGAFDKKYPLPRYVASYLLDESFSDNELWLSEIFMWEKLRIYDYLELFYQAVDKPKKAIEFKNLKKETLEQHPEISKVCST